jgi:hypothetical protein
LYKEKTKKVRDADCLIELRNHMTNNQHLYPLSRTEVSSLSTIDIRDKIRWRQMLLNDFPTDKKAGELNGFITRVTDSRLIEIINESLSIRQDHLVAKGYYQTVQLHLNNKLNSPSKNDIDLVAVLCLRYMYFVRNKTFHAEKLDSAFNLIPNSKEEQELAWCSNILKMLILDLINFNSQF